MEVVEVAQCSRLSLPASVCSLTTELELDIFSGPTLGTATQARQTRRGPERVNGGSAKAETSIARGVRIL